MVVKVSGDNGSGKTTLLDSIYYTLYGSLQRVKPRGCKDQTETAVRMPYKDGGVITIVRRTKTDVTVIIGDDVYQGDRAQYLINEWFGDHDSFCLKSYLRAETMHKFISATPSEKREITHLLFPDSRKYESMISRLREKKRYESEEMDKKEKVRIGMEARIETMETSYPWLLDDPDMTILEISETEEDVTTKINDALPIRTLYDGIQPSLPTPIDIGEMEKRIDEIDRSLLSNTHSSLQSRIQECRALLSRYKVLIRHKRPDGDIDSMERRIEEIDTLMSQYQETVKTVDTKTIQSQIREGYSILGRYRSLVEENDLMVIPTYDTSIPFRINDIKETILHSTVGERSKESTLSYLRGCLSPLTERYDPECIRDYDLTRKLHQLCPSYESMVKKRNDTSISIDEKMCLLGEYKDSLSAKQYNQSIGEILTCPSCGSYLHHTDGLHIAGDTTMKPVLYDVSESDILALTLEIEREKKSLDDMNLRIKEYDDLVTTHPHISDLLSKHGSPAQYNRYIVEMKNKKDKIDTLEKEIAKVENDTSHYLTRAEMNSLESELDDLETKEREYRDIVSRKESVEKMIRSMEESYEWLNDSTYIPRLEERLRQVSDSMVSMESLTREKNTLAHRIGDMKRWMEDMNDAEEMRTLHPWIEDGDTYILGLEEEASLLLSQQSRNDVLIAERKDLQTRISDYNHQMKVYDQMVERRKELEAQHPWLVTDDYIPSLNILLKKIRENNEKKKRVTIYNRYIDIKTKCSDIVSQIDGHQHRIELMVRLEALFNESYRIYMNKKMKSIEYDITILGKMFFDESMNISIVQSGTEKPSFDLHIEYEGKVIDDVKTMSTGQRKIISLIIMIVLTKYLDGKIILLDEAFSSISSDTRGVILSQMEKLNIPVIFTSHDPIPGGYHHELVL